MNDTETRLNNMQETIDIHSRAIFGDKATDNPGLLKMVKEMHDILVSYNNVKGFFRDGLGGGLKWIIIIGAFVGLIKGWWTGLLAYIISHK